MVKCAQKNTHMHGQVFQSNKLTLKMQLKDQMHRHSLCVHEFTFLQQYFGFFLIIGSRRERPVRSPSRESTGDSDYFSRRRYDADKEDASHDYHSDRRIYDSDLLY